MAINGIGRKKGCVPWNKGKPWPKSVIKKISIANTGKKQPKGFKSPNWKEDLATYYSIHNWIRRNWGQPQICSKCGIKNAPKNWNKNKDYFQWSRNGKSTIREKKYWSRLCIKCHSSKDKLYLNFGDNTGSKRTKKQRLKMSKAIKNAWKINRITMGMSNKKHKKISKYRIKMSNIKTRNKN